MSVEDQLEMLMDKFVALQAENKLLTDEMEARNMAASKALDELWKEVVLKDMPNYGNWEYPMQAKRHILCEFTDLRKRYEKAEAEKAAEFQRGYDAAVRDKLLYERR